MQWIEDWDVTTARQARAMFVLKYGKGRDPINTAVPSQYVCGWEYSDIAVSLLAEQPGALGPPTPISVTRHGIQHTYEQRAVDAVKKMDREFVDLQTDPTPEKSNRYVESVRRFNQRFAASIGGRR